MIDYFEKAKEIVRKDHARRQARKLAQDLKTGKKIIAMGRVFDCCGHDISVERELSSEAEHKREEDRQTLRDPKEYRY